MTVLQALPRRRRAQRRLTMNFPAQLDPTQAEAARLGSRPASPRLRVRDDGGGEGHSAPSPWGLLRGTR